MKKQQNKDSNAFLLRQEAAENLNKDHSVKLPHYSEAELVKLLHEMEVYQMELKIQNAELQQALLNADLARRKAEMAEKKYTELYDFAPSGFFTLSEEGEIIELNFVAAKMLGKTRMQLINSQFALFVSEDTRDDFYHFFQNVFASKSIGHCELIIKSSKGQVMNVHVRGILNSTQKNCLINLVDITESKKNELLIRKNEELIIAKEKAEESNRLKSAFLQNITHELRTPLNAICGFSEQINDPHLTSEKRKFFAEIIISSGKQLVSIVEDILTMSTLETGQVSLNNERVNLFNVANELLRIYKPIAKARGIGIALIQPEMFSYTDIFTDRSKIIQILSNLISNALKFTHEGKIEFGYQKKHDVIEFFVKDTGIGIPASNHERIFERFVQADDSIQRHYGGSGLGLAINKGFVELMGGKIWLLSKPESGSTFYFTIPFNSVNGINNPEKELQETAKNQLSNRTILIAEDHDFNYLLLEAILLRENCKVLRAKNGKDAVDICREVDKIDFVLMDIRMPVMDGFTATKLIKQFKPNLPVIAQTAVFSDEQLFELRETFDDFIPKAISCELLLETLRKHIFFKSDKT